MSGTLGTVEFGFVAALPREVRGLVRESPENQAESIAAIRLHWFARARELSGHMPPPNCWLSPVHREC
jgi:hypothetical protein